MVVGGAAAAGALSVAPPVEHSFARLVERARWFAGAPARAVLGITGTPGAGKSTLAAALVDALGPRAVVVGMDGFHLANAELRRLGRQDRKGAPDTFDADGYATLLRRLRAGSDRSIYAPVYDRSIEEAVAAAVPVDPGIGLVITEGNYLLVDRPPWDQIGPLLDQVWYCDVDGAERAARLLRRHRRFGKSDAEARRFVFDSDTPNAEVVEATRSRADLIVDPSWLD
jgi:pantothenate kinase